MIKYLAMDVDGTLTDGKIYMGPTGEAMKAFSIKDGCGIQEILAPAGVVPIVITGRSSPIVSNRCKEMNINHVYQGVRDKLLKLREIVPDLALVAYIGDDVNDLPCMYEVKAAGGIVGCPADSARQVREIADYVTANGGGNGAVRDFIEWIVLHNE